MKKLAIMCLAVASVLLASCASSKVEDTSNFEGAWVVEEFVKDGAVITGATANIEIVPTVEGVYKVAGFAGVNRLLASDFNITSNKIAPVDGAALPSTMMAGTPEAMAYESAFLEVIRGKNKIALEDGKLVISNKNAKITFVEGEHSTMTIED